MSTGRPQAGSQDGPRLWRLRVIQAVTAGRDLQDVAAKVAWGKRTRREIEVLEGVGGFSLRHERLPIVQHDYCRAFTRGHRRNHEAASIGGDVE
jgi:hypothetical protein